MKNRLTLLSSKKSVIMQNEKPRILVKTKNLQVIFDYCIESKTEFTVIPRNTNDDWEIELSIRSIIDAIRWGMFLKTNKIDLLDTQILITPTVNKPNQSAPIQRNKKERTTKTNTAEPVFQNILLEMSSTTETEKNDVSSFNDNITLDFTESNNNNEL